ncbi:hypothetical protein BKA60DRAFT_511446, partial [Fusarium oxysporum]
NRKLCAGSCSCRDLAPSPALQAFFIKVVALQLNSITIAYVTLAHNTRQDGCCK